MNVTQLCWVHHSMVLRLTGVRYPVQDLSSLKMKFFSEQNLKNSLQHRNEIPNPQIGRLSASLVVSVAVYLLLAIYDTPHQVEYHFIKENGAVTVLSAVFMAMGGAFAGTAFYLHKGKVNSCRLFWLLASLVLIFFAIDELLAFHERVGMFLDKSVALPSENFRNWGDIIVIGYGIVGLIALIYFLPAILKYPKVMEILVLAFLLYFIHTLIDSTQEPRTSISVICEETAKIYCSLSLALAMFAGILGVVEEKIRSKD